MRTVFHKLFGEGQVITEDESTITIKFQSKGEKKLLKGASLVLFNSEEEMEEAIEAAEMDACEEPQVKADTDAYYRIYNLRRELERKNLPSSMR